MPPFLAQLWSQPRRGRTIVVGAGKAAAAMAKTLEDHGELDVSGLVVTRRGHGAPTKRIEVVEAAHPVPDRDGCQAAGRVLKLVHGLTSDDLVVCLLSGGGSALLTLPAPGLTLEDKQVINRALLRSGANIAEMNCVRKHLSAIKGGRLAAACHPAKVVTFMISDVPGDDPAVVASGPTMPDRTTFSDASAVLQKYAITQPASILEHLRLAKDETPKANDPRLAGIQTHVMACAMQSLQAAANVARQAGVTPFILGDSLEGESREVAVAHAGTVRAVLRQRAPVAPPCVLLSGGETTVTVTGNGRGGRNTEFLLALAVALDGEPNVYALCADTDGVDGTEENAGAVLTPDTLVRAQARGLDANARLADNDGYEFFARIGDLVVTGPTLTNVNDFRAILILPPS